MSIEWDSVGPALKPKLEPVVSVRLLIAVGEVSLALGEAPRRTVREFYEQVLGLKFIKANVEGMEFAQDRRRIVLRQEINAAGSVGFIIRDFADTLERLRLREIGHEVLHIDGGLSRVATVKDPAGNWVHLLETRPM